MMEEEEEAARDRLIELFKRNGFELYGVGSSAYPPYSNLIFIQNGCSVEVSRSTGGSTNVYYTGSIRGCENDMESVAVKAKMIVDLIGGEGQ